MASSVSLSGGVSYSTLTIPITSSNNAAVAQTALNSIASAVANGELAQVTLVPDGSSPELTRAPAVTEPSVLVVDNAIPLATQQLGNGYQAAVLAGSASQGIITGPQPNETVVAGAAGAMVGNFARGTQVVFGGGNNGFISFDGAANDPSASVWLDGNGAFDLSVGETTIFAGTGANLIVADYGSVAANVVNLEENHPAATANLLELSGTGAAAATVNAIGAGLAVLQDGGAALINANASNVTVYGAPGPGWNGGGSVTLYGGSGTDVVSDGTGYFQAGSAGGSLLIGSTLPGAATLVGGGGGDTVMGLGSGDVLMAGAGNETLSGFAAPVVAVGYTGSQADGLITQMTGGASGGNAFAIGNGVTQVTGNHGSAGGNVYAELTGGPNSNVAFITDFVSAVDPAGNPQANADLIALMRPGGGRYQFEQGSAPGPGQVTYNYAEVGGTLSSKVEFGDGATWTLVGSIVHPQDFG